jgi:L-arabinose isomerase
MNFLAFASPDGPVSTVPFLEASKAMSRGIGYAGEGDVLTASLVGALARGFGDTTFTEIFCPDWHGNSLFLSHMGEVNPDIAADRPWLVEKEFPWTAARNPAVLTCAPRPGPAVFVNLAPGPADSFRLVAAPVEVLGDAKSPAMRNSVRGWIRPACKIADFLEAYSQQGGTHHSALVLGDRAEGVAAFARFAGLELCMIP